MVKKKQQPCFSTDLKQTVNYFLLLVPMLEIEITASDTKQLYTNYIIRMRKCCPCAGAGPLIPDSHHHLTVGAWVRARERRSGESVTRCSLSCAASAVAKSDVFSQSICFIVSWGEIGCDGSTGASFKAKHRRGPWSWPRCSPARLQAGCRCRVQLPAF